MGKLSEKLVIYLDQNFLSEIAKSGENSEVRQEFQILYELLHRGFLEEKLVVPSSWFHEIESCLAPSLKDKIGEFQAYMGQIGMEHKQDIYTYQLGRAANEFLGIENKPLTYRIGFHEDPDKPLEFFRISVDMHLEKFHTTKEREDLAQAIDENRHEISKVKYEVQLEREIEAFVVGFLKNDSWRVGHKFSQDEQKILEFAHSNYFRRIPQVEVGSKLWARLLTAHGNRKIQSGDATDIDVISAYIPYVDVLAIDTFMANNVRALKLESQFETQVFDSSTNGLNDFIKFISEYLDSHESVNRPDVSIFVLSDNKIKEDSFNFFKRLGSLCARHYVDVYGFDDGKMPRYLHKDANVEMPFSGLQEVHSVKISPNITKEELLLLCKTKCRSKKFLLIDTYKSLPDNFVETLIAYCNETGGKTKILGYGIYSVF